MRGAIMMFASLCSCVAVVSQGSLRIAAVACAASFALAVPAASADDGDVSPHPVLVISGGLLTGSEVTLAGGLVLPQGEPLFTGDIVMGGIMVNVAPIPKLVLIEGCVEVIDPGDILAAATGWQCYCTCGGELMPTGHNSPDCNGWAGDYLVNRPCPGGNTWQLPCQQVLPGGL